MDASQVTQNLKGAQIRSPIQSLLAKLIQHIFPIISSIYYYYFLPICHLFFPLVIQINFFFLLFLGFMIFIHVWFRMYCTLKIDFLKDL